MQNDDLRVAGGNRFGRLLRAKTASQIGIRGDANVISRIFGLQWAHFAAAIHVSE